MCETSGSCAIPTQSNIVYKYAAAHKNSNNNNIQEVKIQEPRKFIDKSKQICYYA